MIIFEVILSSVRHLMVGPKINPRSQIQYNLANTQLDDLPFSLRRDLYQDGLLMMLSLSGIFFEE